MANGKPGAPKGNRNGAKRRLPWQQALKRALTRYAEEQGDENPNYRKGLNRVAMAVVRQAAEGQKESWMELGIRLEGKPGTTVTLQGDEDNPLTVQTIERRIIHGKVDD